MVKLKQAIVVEGRYDVNTLRQLVDAPVFETRGFGIMNDREQLALLRAAARRRGLIILTDSDGAGFVIRNFLKNALHGENILQAYIPDIYGKEKRKSAPGKEGKLGVEGMTPEVLLQALRNAGAELDGESVRILRAGHEGRPLYPSAQRTRGQRLAPQDLAKGAGPAGAFERKCPAASD